MEARVQPLRFDGGTFDALRGELRIGDHQARLRPRSAAVLALLIDERDRVVGRDELMRQVWPDVVVTDESLAQCIKEIRRALGPAAERVRTIPRIGYAFAATAPDDGARVQPMAHEAAATGGALADTPAATSAAQRALRWPAAAFALALLALITLGPVQPTQVARPEASAFSVVVLPFTSVGNHAGEPDIASAGAVAVADAIADDLTTDPSRIPDTFVIARSTADSLRGKPVDARTIGRELGVRYLVEGSVQRAGNQASLNVRLVDAQYDGIVWSERFDGARDDLGALQRRVSVRIARTLQLVLIEDQAAHARRHTWADPEQALALLRVQLDENPGYAPAWLWAAIAHLQLGDHAAAAAHAEQAIRLAPGDARLPFFYSVLSRARLQGGDAAGALAAAEQAARAPGPNRYAPLLVAAAAMQLGDSERARQVMARFVARNPGTSAATLRASRAPAGPGSSERDERYIALLVAAGLPER
jgi:TolB-like protein/DNA-binding winged helix-turn-helix (wHTH) protein